MIGNLGLLVVPVGIEPDSLLCNFFDYKNLKAGVVGVYMS